ncbi:MAG: hypothetical protein IKN04_04680 [Clostridia bacterium]|nr:hypothetical protein [Clostridia bacterium]MBR6186716.1 hypothetical protein [Clostridia bacterium]
MACVRRLFPGSNTANGFVGFFQNLRLQADRTVILKGGPGVGKSTLMRDVGRHYERLGMEVDYYFCSGDPDSLDAVFVPGRGFLVMDGTAPHIVDPALPGAGDGILNLGVCLEEKQLSSQKEEIAALTGEISLCYAQAYRYLRAALSVREDAGAAYETALSEKERRLLRQEMKALIPCGAPGTDSHAFLQAITWKGVSQYTDALENERVVCLEAPWGFDADALLRPVWEEAGQRGLKRSAYHDPLDAGKLSHVSAGCGTFTSAVLLDARVLSVSLDAGALRRHSARLAFDRAACELLKTQAVEALSQAKEKHDALERYYIDAMDYARLEEIRRGFLKALP